MVRQEKQSQDVVLPTEFNRPQQYTAIVYLYSHQNLLAQP